MPEKECKQILLNNVWRTCNKIRAALFRSHLDITGVFTELDPHRCSLISESKFVSVLRGRLKHLLGLSDQEIIDLADYFKVQDGRILYTQFCEVIKNEGNNELVKTKPLVSGLEWEEPYHVNCLSVTEERRLRVLLTKMATTVSARRLLLRPYFQDYELVSKNNGSVTLAHFSRVLSFLKIYVSDKDFCLLVKKFMRDGYTMNYIAFIAALEAITQELMEKGMFDLGGDLLSQFPGRILTAELPKLPRPEIGTVPTEKAFGVQTVFHPILSQPRADKDLHEVILRIQRYVLSERVRVGEFFRDFDPLHCGKISESSFRRCLESVGIGESGTRKLYLSPPEIRGVIDLYRDPNDPTRIMWRIFECDIDSVFTTRGLEKWPDKNNDSPPSEVMNLIKSGNKWQEVTQDLRDNCEDVIGLVKRKVLGRRLALRPPFNDCDRCKNGHVSRRQFRTILMSNGIILTNEQMYFLEQRYNDDLGFNYFQFLHEIELQETESENLTEMYQKARLKLSSQLHPAPVANSEKNIICVLAKIKKHVACYRMQICQFMSQHDTCKEMSITANDFRRSLDPKLKLTPTEVDTIVEVFSSAGRPGYVDYQRFCDIVEEAFTQKELHRAPLVVPIPHVSHEDGEHNFLDFQERQTVSTALQKIAQCNHESLIDFYRSMDRTNSGVIPESSVMRGLSAAKLHTVVSAKEAETIVKCFSKIQGIYPAFNYVAFCNAIDYVGRAMKGPAL